VSIRISFVGVGEFSIFFALNILLVCILPVPSVLVSKFLISVAGVYLVKYIYSAVGCNN
jgi:hypothetical protein